MQETFLKAWTHYAEQFKAGSSLQAWLFTILRNVFFDENRKRRREVPDPDGLYSEGLSVSPEQDAHMDMVDFEKAFNKLNPGQREALLLVGVEGLSYEEASKKSGAPLGSIRSRVSRARLILQKSLPGWEDYVPSRVTFAGRTPEEREPEKYITDSQMSSFVQTLLPGTQKVIELVWTGERQTPESAAEQLSLTLSSVHHRLSFARSRLRTWLREGMKRGQQEES